MKIKFRYLCDEGYVQGYQLWSKINFDASYVVPTTETENRPKSVVFLGCRKL